MEAKNSGEKIMDYFAPKADEASKLAKGTMAYGFSEPSPDGDPYYMSDQTKIMYKSSGATGATFLSAYFAPEIVGATVTLISTPYGRQKVVEFTGGYLDYTSLPTTLSGASGWYASWFGPDPKKR